MRDVLIYDAIRTPRGKATARGGLRHIPPTQVLQTLYDAMVSRTALDPDLVDEVILGCVTQRGEQAGNLAKTSTLYAGWPSSVSGLTVARFCSSGLDAVNLGALKIMTAQARVAVAGGIEMMSRVPMLSDEAAVFADPELAAASRMLMMGSGADLIATLYDCDRHAVDQVALMSQQRAVHARRAGYFTSIIGIRDPVTGNLVSEDECPRPQTTAASLASLPVAFAELGASGADALQLAAFPNLDAIAHVHTAGNSPAMADGAAITLLGDETLGSQLGVAPRAVIRGMVNACDEPLLVLSGCVAATKKLLHVHGLSVSDIDLFEIHEAFAATMIKLQRDLEIPTEKLNVNGGCIALGHPLGATGAVMLGTLIDEMERRQVRRGIVATSGAAGLGTAALIERL